MQYILSFFQHLIWRFTRLLHDLLAGVENKLEHRKNNFKVLYVFLKWQAFKECKFLIKVPSVISQSKGLRTIPYHIQKHHNS